MTILQIGPDVVDNAFSTIPAAAVFTAGDALSVINNMCIDLRITPALLPASLRGLHRRYHDLRPDHIVDRRELVEALSSYR